MAGPPGVPAGVWVGRNPWLEVGLGDPRNLVAGARTQLVPLVLVQVQRVLA